jgi:hypothetical protein
MNLLPNEDTFGRRFLPITEETPNIIDESTENVVYIGYAKRGSLTTEPVWKIKKIQINNGITTIGFVDGKVNYNFIWDDRSNYTYL